MRSHPYARDVKSNNANENEKTHIRVWCRYHVDQIAIHRFAIIGIALPNNANCCELENDINKCVSASDSFPIFRAFSTFRTIIVNKLDTLNDGKTRAPHTLDWDLVWQVFATPIKVNQITKHTSICSINIFRTIEAMNECASDRRWHTVTVKVDIVIHYSCACVCAIFFFFTLAKTDATWMRATRFGFRVHPTRKKRR